MEAVQNGQWCYKKQAKKHTLLGCHRSMKSERGVSPPSYSSTYSYIRTENYQCHLWMQFSQVQVFQKQSSCVRIVNY